MYYGREREVHLILSNKGVAQATWQFMSLPGVMFGDSKDPAIRPAPRWAQVTPQQVDTILTNRKFWTICYITISANQSTHPFCMVRAHTQITDLIAELAQPQ